MRATRFALGLIATGVVSFAAGAAYAQTGASTGASPKGVSPTATSPTDAPTTDTTDSGKPVDSIQGQYETKHDYDLDHDGKLSLAEVKSAAAYKFDKLDTDHDGTLTRKELGRRIGATEFKSVDKDKDGTLDKAEYLKIVEARYNAANPDHDQTLEKAELDTAAGKRLRQLLP